MTVARAFSTADLAVLLAPDVLVLRQAYMLRQLQIGTFSNCQTRTMLFVCGRRMVQRLLVFHHSAGVIQQLFAFGSSQSFVPSRGVKLGHCYTLLHSWGSPACHLLVWPVSGVGANWPCNIRCWCPMGNCANCATGGTLHVLDGKSCHPQVRC